MQKGQVIFGAICLIGAIVVLVERVQNLVGVDWPVTNPTVNTGIGGVLALFGISLIVLGLKD
jgi:hypothetical protein